MRALSSTWLRYHVIAPYPLHSSPKAATQSISCAQLPYIRKAAAPRHQPYLGGLPYR